MTTERLAATGRNILARSRRMLLPPPAPALPRAYVSLLLDPADLIDMAWGARLSAPAASPPRASNESFETFETSEMREMREPRFAASSFDLPRRQAPAPSNSDYAAHGDDFARASSAFRDALPLRPTQPPSAGMRPANRRAPVELPVASRARSTHRESAAARSTSNESSTAASSALKPFATRATPDDGASRSFPGITPSNRTPRTRFDSVPLATPTTPTPFSAPQPSPRASEPTTNASPDAFSSGQSPDTSASGSLMRSQPPTTSLRPWTARHLVSSSPDSQADPASVDRREREASARDARAGASRREVAAGRQASASQEPQSVLRFAQSPSRLAAVLSANLDAQTTNATTSRDDEPPHADLLALPAPAVRSLAPHAAPSERAANDETGAQSSSPREAEELSVEGVIAELYERLRLEFLRTYGTSGE